MIKQNFEITFDAIAYRHYKGNLYFYLGTAMNTDNNKGMVIYTNETGEKLYARPEEDFFGTVMKEGKMIDRFTLEQELAK